MDARNFVLHDMGIHKLMEITTPRGEEEARGKACGIGVVVMIVGQDRYSGRPPLSQHSICLVRPSELTEKTSDGDANNSSTNRATRLGAKSNSAHHDNFPP